MEDKRRAILRKNGRTWPLRRQKWLVQLQDGATVVQPPFEFAGDQREAQGFARQLIEVYMPRRRVADEITVYPRGYRPMTGPEGPAGNSGAS